MKNYVTSQLEEKEETVNVREILGRYLRYWKLFLFFLLLSFALAAVYLRFSIPIYSSTATILVNEEEGGINASELSVFEDMGLMGGSVNLENEIEVLKSRTLLAEVAKNLSLQKELYVIGSKSGMQRGEVLEKLPVEVVFQAADSLLYTENFTAELELLDAQTVRIVSTFFTKKVKFGTYFPSRLGKMAILKTADFSTAWVGKKVFFSMRPLEKVVSGLQGQITIESASKEANVITIGLKGPNFRKNNAIIDELIAQHQKDAIQDKNQVANNTSAFINDRMRFITEELSAVENEGQQYKNKYNLVDVTANTGQFMQKEQALDAAISDAGIQFSLSVFMVDFLTKKAGNTELLPSNLGFTDGSIVAMTEQYNTLMLTKNRLLENSSKKNPAIERIENQLLGLKTSLITSLKNNKEAVNLQLNSLQAKQNSYQSKLSEIPKYEREFRDIQRQQQIKETLYLYLMEKREENEIRLAATVDNTKVIDYAYSNGIPVSPKRNIIYLGALLLGLVVPFGLVYLRDLLDTKVHGLKDLENFQLLGVGEIPFYEGEEKIVATKESNHRISEAFRLLRTNINFMLDESKKSHVLIITSTVAGEGKTFTSINLAHALAHSGKKTVLIGLDLRAPKLKNYLGIDGEYGASNFIVNHELSLNDILIPSEENPMLHYVLSGSIPPNPAELLLRPRLNDLIEALREQFEYIVVDTAPVGIVSDTLNLSAYSDLMLYIVRADKSDKRLLSLPQNLMLHKKVPKLAVVVNGVKNNSSSYGYGYGYGYGASNAAYYGEEKSAKLPLWRKELKRFRKKK